MCCTRYSVKTCIPEAISKLHKTMQDVLHDQPFLLEIKATRCTRTKTAEINEKLVNITSIPYMTAIPSLSGGKRNVECVPTTQNNPTPKANNRKKRGTSLKRLSFQFCLNSKVMGNTSINTIAAAHGSAIG